VLPAGTTVAKLDHNCEAVAGRKGEYLCLSVGLAVGQTATWDVSLKIGPAGAGTITGRPLIAGTKNFGPDRNPVSNTAKLLVNPPPASSAANGGGAGGAAGGGLAITGTNVTLAAGAGIALLLAGAVAFAVTRCRRSRYIA
jgi:hypothetical protein